MWGTEAWSPSPHLRFLDSAVLPVRGLSYFFKEPLWLGVKTSHERLGFFKDFQALLRP